MGNSVPLQNMDSATRNYGDSSASTVAPSAPPASDAGGVRAKVLYDYDAADMTELSLAADEAGFLFSFFYPGYVWIFSFYFLSKACRIFLYVFLPTLLTHPVNYGWESTVGWAVRVWVGLHWWLCSRWCVRSLGNQCGQSSASECICDYSTAKTVVMCFAANEMLWTFCERIIQFIYLFLLVICLFSVNLYSANPVIRGSLSVLA